MFKTDRSTTAAAFGAAFARWSAAVRRGRALAAVARGASAGALTASAVATLAWAAGHPAAALAATVAVPAGALLGALVARRRRWDDATVALYLDARGGSAEVITTAVQSGASLPDHVSEHLRREALRALRALDRAVLEPVPARWPLASAGLLAGALAMSFGPRTIPAQPRISAEIRDDRVVIEAPRGWAEVERLARLPLRDEARLARLQALSAEARRLRDELTAGVDRRAALSAAERLRAAVEAERARPWEGAAERGVHAAAQALARAGYEGAAQALEARDVAALDRAMERLANAREAADRQRAQAALAAASAAAEQGGASEVAAELRVEEQLLRRRAERNDLLRALAEQLGQIEDVRRAAEHLERLPSDASARDLAEAMERALAALTPAERSRLADRMRAAAQRAAQASRAGAMDGAAPGADAMSAEELARRLREFAQADDAAGEADDGEAQAGAAGGVPMPMTGGARSVQRGLDEASAGMGRALAQLRGSAGRDGAGEPGSEGGAGRGGNAGEHGGATAALSTPEGVRARARGAVRGGGTGGVAMQRVAGTPGGVARTLRSGELAGAAAGELRGVDRADIPAEYRAQVRDYFRP